MKTHREEESPHNYFTGMLNDFRNSESGSRDRNILTKSVLSTVENDDSGRLKNLITNSLLDDIVGHISNEYGKANSIDTTIIFSYIYSFDYRSNELLDLLPKDNYIVFHELYCHTRKFKNECFSIIKNSNNRNIYLQWLIVDNDLNNHIELYEIIYNNNGALEFLEAISKLRQSMGARMMSFGWAMFLGDVYPHYDRDVSEPIVINNVRKLSESFNKFLEEKPKEYELALLL